MDYVLFAMTPYIDLTLLAGAAAPLGWILSVLVGLAFCTVRTRSDNSALGLALFAMGVNVLCVVQLWEAPWLFWFSLAALCVSLVCVFLGLKARVA